MIDRIVTEFGVAPPSSKDVDDADKTQSDKPPAAAAAKSDTEQSQQPKPE